MPWQNNEDGEDGKPRDNKGSGKKSPWGAGGNPGANGNGDGQKTPPKNPWGEAPRPSRDEERPRGGNTPDFDEFIRRSQEKLRGLGGGGTNGSGGFGGGSSRPNIPWGIIAGAVVLIGLATTSAYRVDAGERAVVTRFGKFSTTNGPGFHLKLPSPIDEVVKVKFEDIRTTQIGAAESGQENLMITGDQNIIDIAYTVRWRIRNAEQYLFQVTDPEETVKVATESAMREMIAKASLNDAIGPERAAIAERVRERVQLILDSYGAGIIVQGLDIRQADPPAAVDESFKDVSAAQQDAQQFLNQARAYSEQISAQADGATAQFDKVYEQYRLAPVVTRKRMYLETMESVLAKVDKTVLEAQGVQAYLPLPELRRRAAPLPEAAASVQGPAR